MATALVLANNGLDSLLTIKLMQQTGISIKVVHFDIGLTHNKPVVAGQRISKYFGLEFLIKNSIELDKINIAKEFYSSIISKHGLGKTNICLDFRIFLFQEAKRYLLEQGADFIVTGDVLDQRPLLQSQEALAYTDKESGLENLVFRPLSAKLIPEPEIIKKFPELKKIMYEFTGFSEDRIELAKKLNIEKYPLDTKKTLSEQEQAMGKKAFDLFEGKHFLNIAHLQRLGSHFELGDNVLGIAGITPFESYYLESFYKKMNQEHKIAFYIKEPKFIFGFIYGNKIEEHHINLASQIFCSIIDYKQKEREISFLDTHGDFLGIKSIQALSAEEYDQYVQRQNTPLCPIIFRQEI